MGREDVSNDEDNNAMSKTESAILEVPSRILAKLGLGGMLGLCAGYSIKQATKALGVVVGGAVVLLQGLQYAGYIEVKWNKIQRDTMKVISSDGSDNLSAKDLTFWMRRMMRILTHQGPTAGGFGLGIYMGLQMN